MKVSAEVVGIGLANIGTRIADIRRRAAERLEAERTAREVRALAERGAEESAEQVRGDR